MEFKTGEELIEHLQAYPEDHDCHTIVVYHPNGQMKARVSKVDGKNHGKNEEWHETGEVRVCEEWENGERHGDCVKSHKGGKKAQKHRKGVLTGCFFCF